MVIWFYFISWFAMVAASPSALNSDLNNANSQVSQASEKKLYIDADGKLISDEQFQQLVPEDQKNTIEFNDQSNLYMKPDGSLSVVDQWIHTTKVNKTQYLDYITDLKKIHDEIDKGWNKADFTLSSMKSLVDAQWGITEGMTADEVIAAWVYYRIFLRKSTLWSSPSAQNFTVVQNNTAPTPIVSPQQSQIDALKALLDWTTNVWVSSLSTSTLGSVWVGKTNTLNADGSKTLSLSVKYKPWTLNPINAYKNRELNAMAELLNNPQSQIQAIEEIMKFTRMRRGGRIGKFVKKAIWKNELSTLSNEALRKEFNEKMNLFVESRFTHLKKDPKSPEAQFAQKIENNIRLAFDQFIAKRIVADINTVLNKNPQQAKVIQMTPTQGSNALAA